VTVISHPASLANSETTPVPQEWRVLWFNDSRQSVARVWLFRDTVVLDRLQAAAHGGTRERADGGAMVLNRTLKQLEAQPDCLAFEYLKTMASAGTSVLLSVAPHRSSFIRTSMYHRHATYMPEKYHIAKDYPRTEQGVL
jgi:hypothetical protein